MTDTPVLTNEEKQVLNALHQLDATDEAGAVEALAVADAAGLGEQDLPRVRNAISWLEAKKLVRSQEHLIREYELTDEGKRCLEHGLPERRALAALLEAGTMTMGELAGLNALEPHERGVAVGKLRELRLIDMAADKTVQPTDAARALAEATMPDEDVLAAIGTGRAVLTDLDDAAVASFEKRPHLFKRHDRVSRRVRLTKRGAPIAATELELVETANQMTPEHIQSGRWRTVPLRPYDVSAFAPELYGGKLHPMRQIIDRVRRVFLDMGFTEVQGEYVRSAFWNLDALFVPQDHPAREMQDTFYLQEPRHLELDDEEFVAKVQAVHQDGGDTGSRGWGGAWSADVGRQALLRTHTTVDTVRHLADHPEPPQRIFSVGRVFRKERVDSTHLPEFHQVEGIVVEEGANLSMLIGTLRAFYRKMGFPDLRVRPSYFPYTEPSLEIDVRYEGKWLELGGAGIFRPEVTKPLGVDAPVLAWGLGIERLAMVTLKLTDIRDLYISDVDWLRRTPQLL